MRDDGTPRVGGQAEAGRAPLPALPDRRDDQRVAGDARARRRLAASAGRQRRTTARNQLIWGDNKLVMSSLLEDYAGQVKLVYIDPPFDTGADFSYPRSGRRCRRRRSSPSILEEHAYRDTWGARPRARTCRCCTSGSSSSMSCSPTTARSTSTARRTCSHYLEGSSATRSSAPRTSGTRSFGSGTSAHSDADRTRHRRHPRRDPVLHQGRRAGLGTRSHEPYDEATSTRSTAHDEPRRTSLSARRPRRGRAARRSNPRYESLRAVTDGTGAYSPRTHGRARCARGASFTTSRNGVPQLQALPRRDARACRSRTSGRTSPRSTARRWSGSATTPRSPRRCSSESSSSSSNEGDLVADFFCGSGTTLVVAEKLGRRWIACDLGRFAIHTTRKRLLERSGLPAVRHQEPRRLRAPAVAGRSRATARCARTSTRSSPSTAPSRSRASPISTAARPTGWSTSAPPMLR